MAASKAPQVITSTLAEDPFCEAAFEDLGEEDKAEFKELGRALKAKRQRHREAHQREQKRRERFKRPRTAPRQCWQA